ncbi:AMP-dependent synthetase [Marinobacterium nitratireducens]|uniref:AMP-dependent synthetase n=1 Tax=Marinobacterium nitratireducens TaxID=518897 RepID=A0A917Z9B1_9GAMM|nr:AMP-binding protein [Marinobacterium nitratireducens]GGO78489.1 AMP-dependent synthetase [Marinobacterium nitratireducens]
MIFDIDRLRAFGDRPCLIEADGTVLDYAGFADRAEAFARTLGSGGERQLIAIEAASEPDAIAAYIGTLAAGHAAMPVPAGDTATAERLAQRFRPAASFRRIDGHWQLVWHEEPAAPLHPDLALLLQTSGSTGHGRGVRLSARAVAANAASIVEYLGLRADDRAALILPLHYSYGLSVLHSHLLCGASLWLYPNSVLESGFAAALEESGATNLAGVPHHYSLLESAGLGARLPDRLRLMTVAGGAMPAPQVRKWAQRMATRNGDFVVMYGQTEATARIAWLPPALATEKPDAVGIAIPGGELLLRDANGLLIETPEAEGELVYRGPNLMLGYAEDHRDLMRGAELSELATGDLARRDRDGIYRISGRLSRMSKIAGLRIGHDALERALADCGNEVAVWGDDRRIAIAVTGARVDVTTIRSRAAELAGIGERHFEIRLPSELPRRANGKIDYPALKAEPGANAGTGSVLAAFRATFAPRRVRPDDSFAGLGGDSLCHVELTLALEERLGGVPNGWERMPISELENARPAQRHGVPTELLARVLAILAVVVTHQTLWPVYGGAAAMVILMGMSVAAYRWDALADGDFRSYLAPMAGVLLPYYAVLAGYALAWEQVPWVSVLMLGNFALTTPETHQMLPYLYWFVEAYVQISLLLALPFLLPPLRRWLKGPPSVRASRRLRFGLGLLALALLLRLTVPEIWPMHGRALFTLPWVLYLFALGWCITAVVTARGRLGVFGLACLIMPLAAYLGGNWHGSWIKYLSLLALVGLLCFVPFIRLPRRAVRPLMRLAQAAFPIYLLHRLVPEVLLPMAGIDGKGPLVDTLAIAGGIGLGLLAATLQRRLLARRGGDLERRVPAAA